MKCISIGNVLTCSPAAGAMALAEDLIVHLQDGTMVTSVCRHGEQRKRIRPVKRYREDSCDVVVSVTDVADDILEDDFVTSVDGNRRSQSSIERDV